MTKILIVRPERVLVVEAQPTPPVPHGVHVRLHRGGPSHHGDGPGVDQHTLHLVRLGEPVGVGYESEGVQQPQRCKLFTDVAEIKRKKTRCG